MPHLSSIQTKAIPKPINITQPMTRDIPHIIVKMDIIITPVDLFLGFKFKTTDVLYFNYINNHTVTQFIDIVNLIDLQFVVDITFIFI